MKQIENKKVLDYLDKRLEKFANTRIVAESRQDFEMRLAVISAEHAAIDGMLVMALFSDLISGDTYSRLSDLLTDYYITNTSQLHIRNEYDD